MVGEPGSKRKRAERFQFDRHNTCLFCAQVNGHRRGERQFQLSTATDERDEFEANEGPRWDPRQSDPSFRTD